MANRNRPRQPPAQAKAARLLRQARARAARVQSWADFSNALFDPEDGLVAQAFPDLGERQAFFNSKEYAAIDRLLSQLMERFGVADGATPKENGKFVVRLPRTLRLTLERESLQEGVSLDELVLAKLSIPLGTRSGSAK